MVLHLHPRAQSGAPPGRDAIYVLAGLPLTSPLRLVPSSSIATPGVRADRDVNRHTSCAVRGAKWLRLIRLGRGRFARSVMCIGMAAPALISDGTYGPQSPACCAPYVAWATVYWSPADESSWLMRSWHDIGWLCM